MISAKNITTYTVLGVLAGSSWWLAEILSTREMAGQPTRGKVDYYSNQLHRTVMSPEGKPKELLFAQQLTHFEEDNRSELEKPVMTLYQESGEPWVIQSETGTVRGSDQPIYLNGDVLITRNNDKGEEIKIVTRNVKYEVDKKYAETSERATIFSKQDELRGIGMQVTFEPKLSAKLLAQVWRKHEMQ